MALLSGPAGSDSLDPSSHEVPAAPARPRRAIVMGVAHPRGVAVIRSLGRAGIPIVAVDHRRKATGFHSRYITQKFHLGELIGHGDKLLGFMESLAGSEGGLLIPTSDPYLVFVAKYWERLGELYTHTTVPWAILEPLMDRGRCYALAREVGIRTPEFWAPTSTAELEEVLPQLDFERRDYVLKTPVWDAPANLQTLRHTLVAEPDAAKLRGQTEEIASRSETFPTLEQVVSGGSDRCIGVTLVVGPDLLPRLAYCVKRLKLYTYSRGGRFQHPYELGNNVFCTTVHDTEAVEAALRFVRHVRFFGTITIEFRRDPESGQLTLIKADPRFVRSTSLSTALGRDVPRSVYAAFIGGSSAVASRYPDGYSWMWISWYLKALRSLRGIAPIRRELVSLLRGAHRIRGFAYASRRDPAPFLIDMSQRMPFGGHLLRKLLRRRSQRRVPLIPVH